MPSRCARSAAGGVIFCSVARRTTQVRFATIIDPSDDAIKVCSPKVGLARVIGASMAIQASRA